MPVDIKPTPSEPASNQEGPDQGTAAIEESLASLAAERIETLQRVHEAALTNIEKAQQRQTEAYARHQAKRLRPSNTKSGEGPSNASASSSPFQPGVMVYLDKPADRLQASRDKKPYVPSIFKVHKLNSKETTATLSDKNGNLFGAHVSRLSLYKSLKQAQQKS